MIDQFHQLKLPVGPLCVRHVLKWSGELLDRHILRGHRVVRRAITHTQRDDSRSIERVERPWTPCSHPRVLIAFRLRKLHARTLVSTRTTSGFGSGSVLSIGVH